MPVPKKRKSPARRDRRRAHHDRVAAPPITYCSNPDCGAPVRPHHVCPECGQYKGEVVIEVVTVDQAEAKKKQRKEKAKSARSERAAAGRRRGPAPRALPAAEKGKKAEEGKDEDDEDKKEKD